MTVAAVRARATYADTGTPTALPTVDTSGSNTPWRFLANSDLVVTRTALNGTVSLLALGADYSVLGAGGSGAGSVTPTAGVADTVITIQRSTPVSQPAHYTPNDAFPAETHEAVLDRLTMAIQDAIIRAGLVPEGELGLLLPSLLARKNAGDGSALTFDGMTGNAEATSFEDLAAAIVAPLIVLLGPAYKGDPGGNVMDAGPVTSLAGQTIPAGVAMVHASGFYADGDGGHGPLQIWPMGTANAVGSIADGRVLIPLPVNGVHNVLCWGMRALGGGTSQKAILDKILANVDLAANPFKIGPRVYFPEQSSSYWFGTDTWVFQKRVELFGDSHGFEVSNQPTVLEWSPATIGIRLERFDTLNGVGPISPTQSGADGTHIHNLAFRSNGTADTANGLPDPTYHGILSHCRWRFSELYIRGFSGNGIHHIASGSRTGDLRGNGNEYHGENCTVTLCGGYPYWFEGADANAGYTANLGSSACGLGGHMDVSFLGSTHVAVHIDSCNTLGQGQVTHGGHIYQLLDRTTGIGASTTPGTNNAIWFDLGTGSGPAAWSGAGVYHVACAIFSDNANARNLYINPYIEGGCPLAHAAAPAMVLGANLQSAWTTVSAVQFNASGVGGFIASYTGMGGFQFLPAGDARGAYAYSFADYDGLHVKAASGLDWNLAGRNGADLAFISNNLGVALLLTGGFTTQAFNRPSGTVQYAANIPILALGSSTLTRIFDTGTAPPASGVSAQGEGRFNTGVAAAGAPGWSCTTGGANGSTSVWKAWANVAA